MDIFSSYVLAGNKLEGQAGCSEKEKLSVELSLKSGCVR
jgi:hypothetical protein